MRPFVESDGGKDAKDAARVTLWLAVCCAAMAVLAALVYGYGISIYWSLIPVVLAGAAPAYVIARYRV